MHLPTLPPSLLPALRSVMRPLVRLMLRKGVTFSSFVNLLKEVFVEVAEREFRLDGKPPSDSRINLLTGVHRKDVRRLRSQVPEDEASLPEAVSLARIW